MTWEHFPDLEAACAEGDLNEILYNSVPYLNQLKQYIQQAFDQQIRGERMIFAVIDLSSGRAIGTTSYHDIKSEIPSYYIGYTWYAQRYQRTYVNRVCKYLLLSYAFEQLNAQVVCFRTDHLNLKSQKAIEALGAQLDGILRCHMLRKDGHTERDSYVYSILKREWVDVKPQLQLNLMKYANKQQFEI